MGDSADRRCLRLCYVSGEPLIEIEELQEEDSVATVKALADEQLPMGTAVSAVLLGTEQLLETCTCQSLVERWSEAGQALPVELVVVTGPQKPRSYLTLDNGGTPFLVRILSRGSETSVSICTQKQGDVDADAGESREQLQYNRWLHEYDTSSPFLQDLVVEQVFIGRSPLNAMTRFSGGHGPQFDGNSIVLKRQKGDYIFVGDEIYTFSTAADIVDYVSPVGNSSVPYPYAVDADGRFYLMIERVVIEQIPSAVQEDPYSFFYEAKTDKCDFQLFCNGAQLYLRHALHWQRMQKQHPNCLEHTVYSETGPGGSKDIPLERFLEQVQVLLQSHGMSPLQRQETLCQRQ